MEQSREDQLTSSIDLTLAKEARVRNQDDDCLEDDEWLALRDAETFLQEDAPGQTVISEQCQLVVHTENVPGIFKVTRTHVYFFDTRPPSEREMDVGGDFQWELSQLREVHLRRYNLRRSALEFFLLNQTNYFINFTKQASTHAFYTGLCHDHLYLFPHRNVIKFILLSYHCTLLISSMLLLGVVQKCWQVQE
jgi:hypothetical protein